MKEYLNHTLPRGILTIKVIPILRLIKGLKISQAFQPIKVNITLTCATFIYLGLSVKVNTRLR